MSVLATLALLAVPAGAAAQATRTWVSGTGDDSFPCSRTAPCKTFAGAYSRTAAGGEIDALDSGGYGAITISKSLTIAATGAHASILVASTNAININTTTDTVFPGNPDRDVVTIRGLDINGISDSSFPGLTGVKIFHAGTVRLENDHISGFSQNGIDFEPTAPTTAGVIPKLVVSNTTVGNVGGDALLAVPSSSAHVLVENSSLESSGCGLAAGLGITAFSPATCGTTGAGAGAVTVDSANSSMSDNTGAGVLSDGLAVKNDISSDLVSGNGFGLSELNGGRIVSIGANSVFGNTTDGAATSSQTTGPVGPVGPVGPTGPRGASGPSGRVELVTCKTVKVTITKRVHGKRRRVKVSKQKCTGKLVSGAVKFTLNGTTVHAQLSHAGDVVASGTMVTSARGAQGLLVVARRVKAGRYTLTLTHGRRLVSRRSVVVG